MRWNPSRFAFSLLFALGGGFAVHAQTKPTPGQIEKADFYFRNNDFAQALPIYQQLDGAQPNDPVTNYRIGVCFFHTAEQETRAIPPLELAARSKDPKVPVRVHQQLGEAYHLTYRFEEAIASFVRYQSLTAKSDPRLKELERQLQASRVAQRLMRDTVQAYIQNLGAPINSPATEYGPVISADESVLMYTSFQSSTDQATAVQTETEDIFIAQKQADTWGMPRSIGLNIKSNIGSVGLSPDGQRLLLYVGGRNANNGDLFSSQLTGRQWGTPVKLNEKVNSGYQESSGSVTSDEKTLYFSSNRPGGLGGYDVYRATKNERGEWDHVVNVGAPVNSRYDEDAPFIHPDKKTLYFNANGRHSMGGNDIFRSVYENGTWSVPTNLGYPINTVYNDQFFVLSADGKKGYFSSNRPGGQGGQDLYFLGIPEEQGIVPLTMMKGRIITGDRQVPTRIRVIDRQSKEVVKNVYHPNRETGQYLIIFPPGRNYDIIIEAEGFLPQVVNIHVPNQNYFYELYQEIYLKAIVKAGKLVGQEIVVKNIFEDVEKNQAQFDPAKFGKNNLDLYELMDNIILSSDSVALDYLLTLMYSKDSPSLQEAPSEPMRGTYYYEDKKGKLLPFTVGGQTVYTLPTLSQVNAQAGELAEYDAKPASDQERIDITEQTVIKPNLTYVFHFDSDKVELGREAIPELEKLYDYLRKYPNYGIRIAGFADADGTSERNRRISEQRAKQVAQYMTGKGIGAQRMVAKGYGQAPEAAKATTETEKRRFRITEITVLEVTQLK